MQNKPRKQRRVNNSPINIDDVSIEAGKNFANWIDIARKTLLQREIALVQQRCSIIDDTIPTMIQHFTSHNAEIFDRCNQNAFEMEKVALNIYATHIQNKIRDNNSHIVSSYLNSIKNHLALWKGCHPNKPMRTFRDYFHCCRKGFDSSKMDLSAVNFWIPIVELIIELTYTATEHIFGHQSACAEYFKAWILRSLFSAQFKPPNTRNIWLVPATVYSTLSKKYYPHLKLPNSKKNREIRSVYLQNVHIEMEELKISFEETLGAHYKCMQAKNNAYDEMFAMHNHNINTPVQCNYNQYESCDSYSQEKQSSDLWSTYSEIQTNDPYGYSYYDLDDMHSTAPLPPPPLPFIDFCASPDPNPLFPSFMSSEF